MAAIKCGSCKNYSFEEGCAIEKQNYYMFRDCMLGLRDLWSPNPENERDQDDVLPSDR